MDGYGSLCVSGWCRAWRGKRVTARQVMILETAERQHLAGDIQVQGSVNFLRSAAT